MIELNGFYNVDCMERMAKIPDNSIDLIVTDPPYLVIHPKREKPLLTLLLEVVILLLLAEIKIETILHLKKILKSMNRQQTGLKRLRHK